MLVKTTTVLERTNRVDGFQGQNQNTSVHVDNDEIEKRLQSLKPNLLVQSERNKRPNNKVCQQENCSIWNNWSSSVVRKGLRFVLCDDNDSNIFVYQTEINKNSLNKFLRSLAQG